MPYAVSDSLSTGTSTNKLTILETNELQISNVYRSTRPHTPSRIWFFGNESDSSRCGFFAKHKSTSDGSIEMANTSKRNIYRRQIFGFFFASSSSPSPSLASINRMHADRMQNSKIYIQIMWQRQYRVLMPICHIHYFIFICLFYYSIICSQLFSVDHIYLQRHCKIFVNETLYFFCIWHSRNSLRMLYAYETIGI